MSKYREIEIRLINNNQVIEQAVFYQATKHIAKYWIDQVDRVEYRYAGELAWNCYEEGND